MQSNSSLFRRLIQNGQEALSTFFEENRSDLRREIQKHTPQSTRRRYSESDVFQELYIESNKRLETYLSEPLLPPRRWLKRLIKQVISSFYRHHTRVKKRDVRREIALDGLAQGLAPLDHLAAAEPVTSYSAETLEELFHAVDLLGDNDRVILTMIHRDGRSLHEAADILKIEYEAVKKRYRRALSRLKKILKAQSDSTDTP